VSSMKSIIEEFHKNKLLIVDMNEYNFLVKDKYFNDVYLIDVDSCQTPSYPATAIMESIKDFHTSPFSPMSDWFSFAILSFQMYTGLHPFKGKHPSVNTFPDKMKQHLSVYNKDVTVPAFIKDFENLIPVNYNEWYKNIFTSKHREAPPISFTDKVAKVIKQVVKKIANLDIQLEKACTSCIISLFGNTMRNNAVILMDDGLLVDDVLYPGIAPYAEVLTLKENNQTYLYSFIVKGSMLCVRNIKEGKDISTQDTAAEYVLSASQNKNVISNRVYTLYNSTLFSVEVNPKLNIVSTSKLADLSSSYKVFSGVIIQSVLGTTYAVLLRGLPGVMENIQIKELSDQRILNAELKENVLVVVTEQLGVLSRYIIKFDTSESYFEKYILTVQKKVQDSEINFIVLDTGVCILADIGQGLLLFRSKFDDSTMNIISDTTVVGHKLFSRDNTAFYADNNNLYKFRMK